MLVLLCPAGVCMVVWLRPGKATWWCKASRTWLMRSATRWVVCFWKSLQPPPACQVWVSICALWPQRFCPGTSTCVATCLMPLSPPHMCPLCGMQICPVVFSCFQANVSSPSPLASLLVTTLTSAKHNQLILPIGTVALPHPAGVCCDWCREPWLHEARHGHHSRPCGSRDRGISPTHLQPAGKAKLWRHRLQAPPAAGGNWGALAVCLSSGPGRGAVMRCACGVVGCCIMAWGITALWLHGRSGRMDV